MYKKQRFMLSALMVVFPIGSVNAQDIEIVSEDAFIALLNTPAGILLLLVAALTVVGAIMMVRYLNSREKSDTKLQEKQVGFQAQLVANNQKLVEIQSEQQKQFNDYSIRNNSMQEKIVTLLEQNNHSTDESIHNSRATQFIAQQSVAETLAVKGILEDVQSLIKDDLKSAIDRLVQCETFGTLQGDIAALNQNVLQSVAIGQQILAALQAPKETPKETPQIKPSKPKPTTDKE